MEFFFKKATLLNSLRTQNVLANPLTMTFIGRRHAR